MPGLDESERTGYYFHWVFPLTTINFMPDGLLMFMVRPLEPELTESTFVWWLPETASFGERLLQAAIVNFGHLVNTEDYEICEHAQKGMRSGVYPRGRCGATKEMCLPPSPRLLTARMRPPREGWDAGRAAPAASANGNGHVTPAGRGSR